MRLRLGKGSMLVALLVSAGVHLMLIVPLLLAVMTASGTSQRMEAIFKSNAAAEDDRDPDQPETKLGIESSRASTFTWVGYDEYEEHLARLAEFDQAAFTDDPIGSATPTEPLDAEMPAERRVSMAEAIESIQGIERILAIELPAQLPPLELPTFGRLLEAVGLRSAEPGEGQSEEARVALLDVEPVDLVLETQPTEEPREEEPEESPNQDDDLENDGGASPGAPGDAADKESDATSTIDVPPDSWRHGKPLAAEGVELLPRRPVFSIVQRLTASPCNPLLEMHFDRAGIVTQVKVIETSRDRSIDAAVEASAYRWRARGEDLEKLSEEDAFIVRMRFILNPSNRCP